MRVTLLGTGTSHPNADRVQSGILVETGEQSILLDVGSGVLWRLNQVGADPSSLRHVLISHFHVDHCSDLASLVQTLWMSGFNGPLKVYGPPPLEQWIESIFDGAYPYLKGKVEIETVVLESFSKATLGDVIVRTCPTVHGGLDSRAFHLTSHDSSLLYTSDTAPSNDIVSLADRVDLLIHECNWLDGDHPEGAHTSPSELREIVRRAHPRRVVLTHLSPEVVAAADRVVEIVRGGTDTQVLIGSDLMRLEL